MNALQQKCRPNHQRLVLKCYPRATKGAVDVKPNSSELSYLLFYATSRRSKIQKIGAFLEKKTASDVWRMRFGNVQVTLGILAALVDKSPKDLALIAPCILKVLDIILRSNDITMIESSLPAFEAFCDHSEASSLFADHDQLRQYRSIVASYARLASSKQLPGKSPISRPVQMRWRAAGLEAIHQVSSSQALSSITGRQIDVIIPAILDNLCTASDDLLDELLERLEVGDKVGAERPHHRRPSIATVKTADEAGDTNPLAISGTALDVDKVAEEHLGLSAMQCLKSIFVAPNRAQIHTATVALLKFVSERARHAGPPDATVDDSAGWAVKIFGFVARWAPVQDRYVILLAALDTMWKTPLDSESLGHHLALTGMIQSLLRSDTNLIGLSVMDVVLGLARQIKRLFQLGLGPGPSPSPGPDVGSQSDEKAEAQDGDASPLSQRNSLIDRLEECIGDLATHVYYADQISDMVLALIGRLKPTRSSSSGSLPPGEEGDGNESSVHPAAPAVEVQATSSPTGGHVSPKMLWLSALRTIKAILIVANLPTADGGGGMDLSRNRVPLTVWEGTQWLLREPDGVVRKGYVDALVTWLDRETTAADSRAQGNVSTLQQQRQSSMARMAEQHHDAGQGRRIVSTASARERGPRERRCQVLPFLHLAAYDSALQLHDHDSDVALLHSLLARLVMKLGVNAARHGIPMVYRLQEDVQVLSQPAHKVRIAALCHGYFWVLVNRFGFESSVGGRAIQKEIARRRSKGFWAEGIVVPPPPMNLVATPGQPGSRPRPPPWDTGALESEALLPFDDRASLVQGIAESYHTSQLSPPGSPSASQGARAATLSPNASSMAAIGSGGGGGGGGGGDRGSLELPSAFREGMLAEWSREGAMAALAASKADSLNGSRTGTTGTNQNHRLTVHSAAMSLGVGMGINEAGSHLTPSPLGSVHRQRPHSSQLPAVEPAGSLSRQQQQQRKTSALSGISPSASESSRGGVASVEQLKMMLLSGGAAVPRTAPARSGVDDSDDSDDSMVSCEDSGSDRSQSQSPGWRGPAVAAAVTGETLGRCRSASGGSLRGPLTSNPPFYGDGGEGGDDEDEVPPVPPLPKLSLLSAATRRDGFPQGTTTATATLDYAALGLGVAKTRTESRSGGGESAAARRQRSRSGSSRGMDLQELLRGLDCKGGSGVGGVGVGGGLGGLMGGGGGGGGGGGVGVGIGDGALGGTSKPPY